MTPHSSSPTTISIGIIGCGRIAQAVHIPILMRLRGARITALADPDATRLSQASALAPHAARFPDYARLLATADVNAVVVSAPPALHSEVAIAALQADKNVYLEKPLATTLEDAERVCDVWRSSGRVGMIGFNYRFNRLYQEARKHLSSGSVGPLVAVRSIFSTTSDRLPDWTRSRSSGGGALLDLASHDIDLIHFLFGRDAVDVSADLRSLENEHDTAVLQMRLADGVPVQLIAAIGTAEEALLEIYGQRGKITVNRYQGLAANVSGQRATGWLGKLWSSAPTVRDLPYFAQKLRAPMHEPSFAVALEHFLGAIRGRHPAGPDFHDGYRSLSVILAAEESARAGRLETIELPAREPDATGAAPSTVSGGTLK